MKFRETNYLPLHKLIICALFTALIAILAQIAIPVPFSPVPFTGQIAGIFIAGALLGSRAGVLSVTAYLLLGAAGAPVFSLGRGGLYMLTGPGGGYLWGFIPAVYLIGLLLEKSENPSPLLTAATMLPALGVVYLMGGLQMAQVLQFNIKQVLIVGVIPFLPFDLIKIALSTLLSIQLRRVLQLNNLAHFITR
ncbi:MAG: biotin transporter BioY [Bacillota bacterium]